MRCNISLKKKVGSVGALLSIHHNNNISIKIVPLDSKMTTEIVARLLETFSSFCLPVVKATVRTVVLSQIQNPQQFTQPGSSDRGSRRSSEDQRIQKTERIRGPKRQ